MRHNVYASKQKKIMKKVLSIAAILLLTVSCGSKKETVMVSETIEERGVFRQEVFLAPQTDVLEIANICDTLEIEKPVEVLKTIVRGADTISLSIENNNLKLQVKTLGQLIKEKDSINEMSNKAEVERVEVTRYKYPTVFWVLIAYSIVATIFCVRMIIR